MNAQQHIDITKLFDSNHKYAVIVLCVTLLACAIGFRFAIGALNIYLAKEPVPLQRSLTTIPKHLGEWRTVGEDILLDAAMIEELGTSDYLNRTYMRERNGEQQFMIVHLAYYTGMIDAVPHVPDRCFVAHGMSLIGRPTNMSLPIDRSRWHYDEDLTNRDGKPFPIAGRVDPITRQRSDVLMPIGEPQIRMSEFQSDADHRQRLYAGYFFIANGRMTPQPEEIRMLAFSKSEKYAYYMKVQLSMAVDRNGFPADVNEFLEVSGEFMDLLLPEIMWTLPDWSTVDADRSKVSGDR